MAEPIDYFIQEASGKGHKTRLAGIAKEQIETAMMRELEFLKQERQERARRLGLCFPSLADRPPQFQATPKDKTAREASEEANNLRLSHSNGNESGCSEIDTARDDVGV